MKNKQYIIGVTVSKEMHKKIKTYTLNKQMTMVTWVRGLIQEGLKNGK